MSRFSKVIRFYVVAGMFAVAPYCAQAVTDEEFEQGLNNLSRLHNLVVLHQGQVVIDQHLRGPESREPANIKSLSKSVLSLLVGIAIDKGFIESLDTPAVDLLGDYLPDDYTPAFEHVTVEHLLSMQSGLQPTSGGNYGSWVASSNWTRYALTRGMIEEPGGRMVYSTGNSHILAAILTEQTGRTLFQLAREWLGEPLNIRIYPWMQAPEGIYFGGNEMLLSAHALGWIGQVYLGNGQVNGRQVVSAEWVEESFRPRTESVYTDDPYGLGWFSYQFDGVQAYYGRGYGGQLLYIIPELQLSIVMTSDPNPPSRGSYIQQQHRFVAEYILPRVEALIQAS